MSAMKVPVAGWFSFADGHATAGDLLNRDVTCEWSDEAGCAYDIAVATPFCGGVNWRRINPDDYSHSYSFAARFSPGGMNWSSSSLLPMSLDRPKSVDD